MDVAANYPSYERSGRGSGCTTCRGWSCTNIEDGRWRAVPAHAAAYGHLEIDRLPLAKTSGVLWLLIALQLLIQSELKVHLLLAVRRNHKDMICVFFETGIDINSSLDVAGSHELKGMLKTTYSLQVIDPFIETVEVVNRRSIRRFRMAISLP